MPNVQEQHGTQNEMWNTTEIQKFYAKYAEQYDKEVDSTADGDASYPSPTILFNWALSWFRERAQFSRALSPQLKQSLAGSESLSVLDLGCGTGQSCAPFAKYQKACTDYSFDFFGVDATKEMLCRAKERLNFRELIQHDLESYPYPDALRGQAYDILLCVGVMDFIRDPVAFLGNAARFMKSESSILCLTMPEHLPDSLKQELSSFSRAEMESLFHSVGLKIERHGKCIGYKDSESGVVRTYHLWILTI
ncbi:hypothetical protein MP228_001218 [Amoeboaphelidium protococcarum]|nr:hypothetical protein MP228_001218 [Amoeboaphelidium protococcarum]